MARRHWNQEKSAPASKKAPLTLLLGCLRMQNRLSARKRASLPGKLAQVGWLSRQEFMGVLMRNEIHNWLAASRSMPCGLLIDAKLWEACVRLCFLPSRVRVSFIFQKPTAGSVGEVGAASQICLSRQDRQTSCWLPDVHGGSVHYIVSQAIVILKSMAANRNIEGNSLWLQQPLRRYIFCWIDKLLGWILVIINIEVRKQWETYFLPKNSKKPPSLLIFILGTTFCRSVFFTSPLSRALFCCRFGTCKQSQFQVSMHQLSNF